MTADERRQKIIAEINAKAAHMAREPEAARMKPQQPLTRQQRIIAWGLAIAGIIALFVWPYLLLGVLSVVKHALGRDDGRASPWRAVESIEVEGDCAEDHVKDSAPYAGRIEHTHNVTTDAHQWSGYVTHRQEHSQEVWMTRLSDPYRYEPSFAIGFTNLRPDELQGDVLHLEGVSEFLADEESRRPSYRATCTLRVIRRLDHQPSRPEATAP